MTTDPWQAAWREAEQRESEETRAAAAAAEKANADRPLLERGAARLREIGQRAADELSRGGVPQPPTWSYTGRREGWQRTPNPGVWSLRVFGMWSFAVTADGLFRTNASLTSPTHPLQPPYVWVADRRSQVVSELCWTQSEYGEALRAPFQLELRPCRVDWVDPPERVVPDTTQAGITVNGDGEPMWWTLGNTPPSHRYRFEELAAKDVVEQITQHRGHA